MGFGEEFLWFWPVEIVLGFIDFSRNCDDNWKFRGLREDLISGRGFWSLCYKYFLSSHKIYRKLPMILMNGLKTIQDLKVSKVFPHLRLNIKSLKKIWIFQHYFKLFLKSQTLTPSPSPSQFFHQNSTYINWKN